MPWGANPPGGDKAEQAVRVGRGLHRLRTAAGLSRAELGSLAGVTEQSVNAWEEGRGLPSANSLAHVLFAIGTAIDGNDTPAVEVGNTHADASSQGDPYVECSTVDRALARWLDIVLSERQAKYRDALLQRFGWNTTSAVTLQEAGDLVGVTRERLRQVAEQTQAALSGCAPPVAVLDAVADAIWSASPIFVDDVSELLGNQGLLEGEIDCLALLDTMRGAGIHDVPAVFGDVIASSETEARTRVDYWSRVEHALSSGRPLHVIDLVDVSDDVSTTVASTRERLGQLDWVHWLNADWLVDRRRLGSLHRFNPLTNTVDKLIRACGPLHIENVLDGVAISSKRKVRGLVVPPADVFEHFLRIHGCFEIDADRRVGWAVDYEGRSLADGEVVLVDLLRQRPHWRWSELRDAVVAAGLSEGFVAVAGQFSPLMMRLDHDQWCLRTDDQKEVRGRGMNRMDETFGSHLRIARLSVGISQRELGEAVGATQPEVSRWESGDEMMPKRLLSLVESVLGTTLGLVGTSLT